MGCMQLYIYVLVVYTTMLMYVDVIYIMWVYVSYVYKLVMYAWVYVYNMGMNGWWWMAVYIRGYVCVYEYSEGMYSVV